MKLSLRILVKLDAGQAQGPPYGAAERDAKYVQVILTGKQQMYMLSVTEMFAQTMQPAM